MENKDQNLGRVIRPPLPCKSTTRVILIDGDPVISISRLAYNKMSYIIELASEEFGWIGTISREGNAFSIEDVFLLPQEVGPAKTKLTSAGLADFGAQMMESPEGKEILNKIRFWGHSHDWSPTTPSEKDEEQMGLFEQDHNLPFFIRGIFNKNGDVRFTIFLFERGVVCDNVEWEICDDDNELKKQVAAEMKDVVGPKSIFGGLLPSSKLK